MPQACQDPAPDDLNADFDFGLVARLVWARWNDGAAVMPRQVGVGPVDRRLMEAGLGDPGLEIVADRLAGDAAEISEGADMRRDPIGQLLAPHRLGVGEIRRAQDGDEDLYRDDLAGEAIDDLAGAAGEVDKQLLAGDMGLAHRRLQPARPTLVKVAEPGIAEPVGRAGSVLLPQRWPHR